MWSYQDELIPRKHQVDGTQLLIYIYIQSIYFAILSDVTCLGSLLQCIGQTFCTNFSPIPHSRYFFLGGGGVKFSWMLRFVVIRGKKIVVGSGRNYTPRACVELWPLVSK